MPGLIETHSVESQTFDCSTAKSRRSSSSIGERVVRGNIRSSSPRNMIPADSSERDVVNIVQGINVGDMSSMDLYQGHCDPETKAHCLYNTRDHCCPDAEDHSVAETAYDSDTLCSEPAQKNEDVGDLNSTYTTDCDDVEDSLCSNDQCSDNSKNGLDCPSLVELCDQGKSVLSKEDMQENCPDGCVTEDGDEIQRCDMYVIDSNANTNLCMNQNVEEYCPVLKLQGDVSVIHNQVERSTPGANRDVTDPEMDEPDKVSSLIEKNCVEIQIPKLEKQHEEVHDFKGIVKDEVLLTTVEVTNDLTQVSADVRPGLSVMCLTGTEHCVSDDMGAVKQIQFQECSSSHRQRSLEPEPVVGKQLVGKTRSSSLLQRSKSYPQVSQRAIFMPIRPTPEQSGLYVQAVLRTVDTITSHRPIPEGDSSAVESTIGEASKVQDIKRSRKTQSRPPVARVNPQTNTASQYTQLQQEQMKAHKDDRASCQQAFYIQDYYQQGSIPVIFASDPAGGCYVIQDYLPGIFTPEAASVIGYHQNNTQASFAPGLFEHQNYSPNQQMQETQRNPHCTVSNDNAVSNRLTLPVTFDQTGNMPEPSKCANSRRRDSDFSHTMSSLFRQDRSHCLKRRHKKPLLPDPIVPKYSDMTSSASMSVPSLESYRGNQQYHQEPFYIQPYKTNSSVCHVNPLSSPSFSQHVPFPGTSSFPSGRASVTAQPTTGNLHCTSTNTSSSQTPFSEAVSYSSSSVGFIIDQTGLIIYGPQPLTHEPAACIPDGSSSTGRLSTTQTSSISHMYHQCPRGNNIQDQQLQISVQTQQPPSGTIYLPENSDPYITMDSAAVQSHVDPSSYHRGYNQELSSQILLTNPVLPVAVDGAQGMQAVSTDVFNSPATVRMVSSNGPPVPMPMQVPPGHMVQQIVDENGILTHVILSPQPAGPGGPMPVGPYGGPGAGSQYFTTYGAPHYGPHQYSHHPHNHPVPPHVHGGIPHINSPGSGTCTNHVPVQSQGEYGVSPPLNSIDDRTLRTKNRVRKKLQRRINLNDGFYLNPPRQLGGRRNRNMGVNGDLGMHGEPGLIHGHYTTQENGSLDIEEENSLIVQCLSSLPTPKVTDVDTRSSLIQLSPPDCDSFDVELDPYEIKYELLLSDKGRDAKYKTVFSGDASEITLTDLKPATEYHLKVCAVLTDELKGALTQPVSFQTLPCEPEPPQTPKLMSKTKTSLHLKWNATCDNGSKITTYCLECDQGQGDGRFYEIYSGLQRQFRATRLNASTRYSFRLMAINSFGKSSFSEEVSFFTSGSVPFQPDPPMLSEQFVYALTISWIRRPNDDEFMLQMEDESTGHGFITVYSGSNLSYIIRSLRRNTEYRFRLCTKNEEGQSKWSEIVSYRTHPERPQPPSKPQIKGKISPYSFRITWDPPQDSGGTEITKYIVELDDGQGYDTVYEGSEREHLFDHLTPGHVYHVRVACCSIGGRSDFSDSCVATTLPVAPSQCQVPKLQGKPKATSLHLRWGNPDYDGGAQVMTFAAQMISPDNTAREVYKGHDRDCIVTGLLPGRPYLFQVRAFNRAGAGSWSDPLEVVSGAGVPECPKAPHVLCRSAHSALVTWEEPFNNGAIISEYRLEWQQRSDATDFSQLYVGPNQSFDVKGLTPATMYTFRVQAINSAGPGLYSSSTSCVTPPSSPSAIISVRVKTSATSLTLIWQEPNCNGSDITSYNIVINERPPIVVDSVTEYQLEDLLPETQYKIRVQAVNGIGVGPFSPIVKCSTKALPPSPPRVECVLLAPTSIKLKWGEGRNSDLLTYTLEMEKEDGNFQAVYTGPAHMHKVTRLTELTSYEFRIFASNDAGSGPYSDTYTFTTTKTPPPAPKAPKVRSVTSHGCLLEWQAVKPMGRDSMVYHVQMQCLSGKDMEYKQIYKGSNTQFYVDSLQPSVEYQVRIAAVRLASDGTGDIIGAFSPGTIFSPLNPEPQKSSFNASTSREERTEERKPWSDQQYAAVILCLFVLLAIVSAFLCQQLISYMSGTEDSSSSTSSLPSSASTSSPSSSHNSGDGLS